MTSIQYPHKCSNCESTEFVVVNPVNSALGIPVTVFSCKNCGVLTLKAHQA